MSAGGGRAPAEGKRWRKAGGRGDGRWRGRERTKTEGTNLGLPRVDPPTTSPNGQRGGIVAGGGAPSQRWLRRTRERPGTVIPSRPRALGHVVEPRRQRLRAPYRKSRRSREDNGKSQGEAGSSLIREVTWASLTWLIRAPKWDV